MFFLLSKIEEPSETLGTVGLSFLQNVKCILLHTSLTIIYKRVLRHRQVVFEPGVSPSRRIQLSKQLSVLILRLQRMKEPTEVLGNIVAGMCAGNGAIEFP